MIEVVYFVGRAQRRFYWEEEEFMPRLVGFSQFSALPEEQISEKIGRRILSGDEGMIVWWRGWCPCRAAQSLE